MKVLVTGGAGFIGSNFVRKTLETRPHVELTVLDKLTYAGKKSNLLGSEGKIEFIEGDICDSQLVSELVLTADLVINFAAESHNDNSLENPEPFLKTNIMGTFQLINAVLKHGKRYHHVSTDEVFGDLELDSSDKFLPDSPYNPSSPYSASKAASDHLVRAWVRSFGLKATISNCSNNFGPNQHEEKLIPNAIRSAIRGIKPKIYGDGRNIRDWIHVDDHNDGIWAVIERGRSGETYLLGTNNPRSNLEVVRTILSHLNLDGNFIEFVKDRPGHDKKYAIDSSKANLELGWTPETGMFENQLKSTIDFYIKSY